MNQILWFVDRSINDRTISSFYDGKQGKINFIANDKFFDEVDFLSIINTSYYSSFLQFDESGLFRWTNWLEFLNLDRFVKDQW